MNYTDKEKKALEEAKITIDYLKHLTTLSTGSLLLIATFIEKIFVNPAWKPLVGISIGAFLLNIISAVAVMSAFVWGPHDDSDDVGSVIQWLVVIGSIGVWAGFLGGVMSFAIFVLKNLY